MENLSLSLYKSSSPLVVSTVSRVVWWVYSESFCRFSLYQMEDISGLCGRLSLTDKEEAPFDFGSEEDDQFYLAARFMTGRFLNIESVVRTFRPLWRTVRGFTVRDLGHNMLVFAFEDVTDLERVLQGEPWSYDKHLVSFQRVDIDTEVSEMQCGHVSLWVQIHNLPIGRMKSEFALALGSAVGEVEQVAESEEEKGYEGCMRIRVKVDISKPLCRGRKARLASSRETWISFKYERLPIFCYWCGCLTHGEKDCEMWLKHKGELRREEQQYGAWLRASVEKPVRRIEIKVEGRSNVPRWGQQPSVVTPISSKVQNREAHVPDHLQQRLNDPILGSEEITDQSPPIIGKSCESGRDLERDIREIDEALYGSTTNLEVFPKQKECNPDQITSHDLRDIEHLHETESQGGEVDQAIEDLRNRVILQDILGTKAKCGKKLSTRRQSVGKENLCAQPLNHVDLNAMHEVTV